MNIVIKHDNPSLSFLNPMAACCFAVGSRFLRNYMAAIDSLEKFQFASCFFFCNVVVYLRLTDYVAYPGVAKFGIALDWGSRGRRFKSCHSDQKSSDFC